MGFFADNIPASEQDVLDVAKASSADRTAHYRLRKRRAIARNPDSRAARLLNSCTALPEPDLFGGSEKVITLRIRSLKKGSQQHLLPVFAEGDVIVGVAKALKGKGRKKGDSLDLGEEYDSDEDESKGDEEDDESDSGQDEEEEEDEDEDLLMLIGEKKKKKKLRRTRTHTSVFSVCAVYWGTRAYVNMMVDGSGHRSAMEDGRAAAGQNCFVVCRIVKAG